MIIKKTHIISKLLKTKTLSFVFSLFALFVSAQKSAEKQLISVHSTQNTQQNSQSSFFSDTPVFISDSAIFSLQLKNINFNKKVFGEGLLHIANIPNVNLASLRPLSVAHVKIENTQLQLQNILQVTGELKLVKATILLNEFNLITEKELLFDDDVSNVLQNSTGIWIKPQINFSKSLPKNKQINNTYISFALIYDKVGYFSKKYLILKLNKNNKLNKNLFCQVPKPPPKFV